MKTVSILAALYWFQSLAFGGLQWEKKEIEFNPLVTDKEVKADFNFTNAGREPVTIVAVEPGCGCTTAVLEKRTYRPGEKGHIAATFTIGQRTGLQNKPIRVTVRGEKEETVLTMITHIPELMKVSPQLVFWQTGEAPEAKTIELTAMRDAPLRVTKVTSTDPKMKAAIETVQEGKSYKVVVTPAETAAPVSATLTIETELAPNVYQYFTAYAHVKQAKSSRAAIWVYKDGETSPTLVK